MAVTDADIPVGDLQVEPPLRLHPSDFYGFLRPSTCGLRVWLRAHGEEEDPPGVYAEMLMRLGIEHERRHLRRFPDAIDIAELPRDVQARATAQLVDAGERVVYQGRLEATATLAGREVEISGLPDFMLPARDGYAIRDSKLNRRVGSGQEHVRLQLEAYGWLYERTFGEPPAALQVHAGSGEILTLDYGGGDDALALAVDVGDGAIVDQLQRRARLWQLPQCRSDRGERCSRRGGTRRGAPGPHRAQRASGCHQWVQRLERFERLIQRPAVGTDHTADL